MNEPLSKAVELKTVGDLIDWLEILGRNRPLVYDTVFKAYTTDVYFWNEEDEDSPVSINVR